MATYLETQSPCFLYTRAMTLGGTELLMLAATAHCTTSSIACVVLLSHWSSWLWFSWIRNLGGLVHSLGLVLQVVLPASGQEEPEAKFLPESLIWSSQALLRGLNSYLSLVLSISSLPKPVVAYWGWENLTLCQFSQILFCWNIAMLILYALFMAAFTL